MNETVMRMETKLKFITDFLNGDTEKVEDPLNGYELWRMYDDGSSMWRHREEDLTVIRDQDGNVSEPEGRTWEEGEIHAINPARDMSPFEPRGWKA